MERLAILFCAILCGNAGAFSIGQGESLDDIGSLNITFFPTDLNGLVWGETAQVVFKVHSSEADEPVHDSKLSLCVVSGDKSVAIVKNNSLHLGKTTQASSANSTEFVFLVEGVFLGRTQLNFFLRRDNGSEAMSRYDQPTTASMWDQVDCDATDDNSEWHQLSVQYDLSVVRPDRLVDKIFMGFIPLIVLSSNIALGCTIDLSVVREVLRRPIAPVTGFCCQFLVMPLAAYSFVRLFGLEGGVALGFFASGCAPGGGPSNMYSFLLGGDVSLSVTMTLVSLMASIGMIPLWMYTLGRLFLDEYGIVIPYQNIVIAMIAVIGPVGIGLLIQKKIPKVAEFIVKRILRVWFIIKIVVMVTLGIFSNLYIFKLMTPTLFLAGCALPYTGFMIGGIVAAVTRQPFNRILTIAIETGIQNTSIPLMLMKFTLPNPEGDMAMVGPCMIFMCTPIPLLIALVVLEIRKRCCRRKESALELTEQANGKLEKDIQCDEEGVGDDLLDEGK